MAGLTTLGCNATARQAQRVREGKQVGIRATVGHMAGETHHHVTAVTGNGRTSNYRVGFRERRNNAGCWVSGLIGRKINIGWVPNKLGRTGAGIGRAMEKVMAVRANLVHLGGFVDDTGTGAGEGGCNRVGGIDAVRAGGAIGCQHPVVTGGVMAIVGMTGSTGERVGGIRRSGTGDIMGEHVAVAAVS